MFFIKFLDNEESDGEDVALNSKKRPTAKQNGNAKGL
jgi:hypothetical protein